jgi:F-type H+/Na+-transporting ATPase subunit alpha
VIYAAVNGHLDDIPVAKIKDFEKAFMQYIEGAHPEIAQEIVETKKLSDELEKKLVDAIARFKESFASN